MKKPVLLVFLLLAVFGCSKKDSTRGEATDTYGDDWRLPDNHPEFPTLDTSCWVVDKAGVMSNELCQKLHEEIIVPLHQDRICEMAVLIIEGVTDPEAYATNWGRFAGLGKKGRASQGNQNGLVWLICPDLDMQICCSPGRGFPKITDTQWTKVALQAKPHIENKDYNQGVRVLLEESDKTLRQIYGE